MNIAEQSRREVKPARWHFHWRLPAGCAVSHALIHQSLNTIKLDPSDNRTNVDRFIEWRAYAEGAHAGAYFCDQRFDDTLLHEQAGAGATHLPLIEPDSIHQTFDSTVEVGVFKHDKRRFAAQFERKPLVALCGRAPDRAPNFG